MKSYLLRTYTLGPVVQVVILLSLVVSGCGPAATAAPEVPATEAPATAAPGAEILLTFLYPGTPDSPEGALITSAVDEFEGEFGIGVDLQFIPGSSYRDTLRAQTAAGDSPDVAKLNYTALVELYLSENLLPLEEAGDITSEFLEDALNSARFDNLHYGLPQWRDSCSLAYEYLSIFSTTQYPQDALLLIDFLTNTERQKAAFEALAWYPTREPLYSELGLTCPLNEAIRIPPDQVENIVNQVRERSPVLEPVLDGAVVIPEESTGVIENEELVGFGAAIWNPISREDAEEKMATTGLVIGVLFINNIPEYPSGDYVVKCYTEQCVLVDPSNNEIPYDLLISEEFETPVQVPRVALVPGSTIKCTWYLFWVRCTRVG